MTAIQLLPIQEFSTQFSLGYNGVDYFSPEMDFAVADADLPPYLARVNQLLSRERFGALCDRRSARRNESTQGVDRPLPCARTRRSARRGLQPCGRRFRRREHVLFRSPIDRGRNGNSLYFTDRGHAGGLVFDFGKPEVRDFLIQNARFFLEEYRVDGFRYDQVSVIDHDGAPHGWSFCQDLTATVRFARPSR